MTSFFDPKFLNELLAGSYETAVLRVSEAVTARSDLFGEGAEVIGTFGSHVIVLNPDGKAWRARYEAMPLGGIVSIVGTEPVNIPSKTEYDLAKATKDAADAVVDAMLAGKDQETLEQERELLALAQEGISLTMQTVEADVESFAGNDFPWRDVLRDAEDEVKSYLGSEVKNDEVPAPKFGDVLASFDDEEQLGLAAEQAMTELLGFYVDMSERLAPAEEVEDDWEMTAKNGEIMTVPDFVEFAEGLSEDIEELAGYAEDALATSDTDPVALARVYDMLSAFAGDVWLGVAFAAKLAASFKKAG